MKLKLMPHQITALEKMSGKEAFALFMEQGTGKTATLTADAELEFSSGNIDAVLVVAPKGVHISWVKRELPKTLSVPYRAAYYLSGNAKAKREVEKLFDSRYNGETPELKVLTVNYDALITKEGWATVLRFLRANGNVYGILDESTRIKNPTSKRTGRCMMMQHQLSKRRIATGTPVADSPIAVFQQMEFIESGLLGTTSYRAFVSEYAELVPDDGHLMRHIQQRQMQEGGAAARFKKPQILARDDSGRPIWRNLDKLHRLLEPHSFRALKKDCLALPPKIYETVYFEMDKQHQRLYDQTKRELRIIVEEDLLTFNKLTILTKLQQITSGFIKVGDEHADLDNKQRISTLLDVVEDAPGQAVIWAKFRKEIDMIAVALREAGHEVVEYHGGTSNKDREYAIDSFQDGRTRFFVGHQKAAGIGLTLTAANTVIYYSNDYSAEERQQSEDRAHRIGTIKPVTYIDIVALDTIDERIAEILQSKNEVAKLIMGD
jgi:SNF2 family DNA or RNA helicase